MCSSSQGDQPFNITWLKDNSPITYKFRSSAIGSASASDHHEGNVAGGHAPISSGNVAFLASSFSSSSSSLTGSTPLSLANDPSLTINEYAPFSSILSIHNVTSRHNGNYTCRVSNRAGSVEYTAKLSVSGKISFAISTLLN